MTRMECVEGNEDYGNISIKGNILNKKVSKLETMENEGCNYDLLQGEGELKPSK